jgi:hypothetical protein|tara:strand:+ start:2500 stop:2718 length:219 start_codon:yes stop_codon:yes gene_type:complete
MIEIFGWLLLLTVVTNIFYKKGIRKGINHALLKLHLNQDQINLLNEELKRDSHDLAVDTIKEIPKKDLTLYN